MCVAVPMQVREVHGTTATVGQEGVTRTVRVDFLRDLAPGDYVLVHAGVAIERMHPEEAAATLELLRELSDGLSG